jgi:hypothetical protein
MVSDVRGGHGPTATTINATATLTHFQFTPPARRTNARDARQHDRQRDAGRHDTGDAQDVRDRHVVRD